MGLEGKLARDSLRQMMKKSSLTCKNELANGVGALSRRPRAKPGPVTLRNQPSARPRELMGSEKDGAKGSNK
ncbi:hypothetical protein [Actinocrinis sp.]|uniref:hypothetical protein n=1 Tax=Actinocrinis sp. TaxID=1920516 RepID=UPI002DDCEBBD|nr:hypothetical protein [Actinocrinis sp.]